MPFNLSEYYKALNGESTETNGVWHLNNNKSHAHKIFSDFDALGASNDSISLPPSPAETELINFFSDKLGQKLKNTKITSNLDGTESVDLELDDRVVTIIMDQSGSMTWNDNNNFRHDIATDLVNKIEINYPGDIKYNLVEYGADIINVLFFGVIENDAFDPNNIDSLSAMVKADDEANYDGMRVIRNNDHYPTSVLDGDVVDDGFISRIKDTGLVEGQTYYYTVYTYDKNFKYSEGTRIKVTPRERVIPRSHSNFRTVVDSEDLTKGIPFLGSGVNRDDNTLGIWHMDEGEGKFLYDFSSTGAIVEYNKEDPTWYNTRFVPSGTSGLFFDGENDVAQYEDADDIYEINFNTSNKFTFMVWIYPYDLTKKQVIFGRSSPGEFNYSVNISSSGNLSIEFTSEEIEADSLVLELNKWQHIAVVYNDDNPSGSQLTFYVNGESQNKHSVEATQAFSETHTISIGNLTQSNLPYRGKLTELSFHNVGRDSDYINSQLVVSPILDNNDNQVDTEIIGIKEDNGDRLVIFKYNVPRDYNYVEGEVLVVKNEKNIPSWEEDGTIIYQVSDLGTGQFFISDSDDFVLGEKYYYRLFTKNSLNNVSFITDSPSLTVSIPGSSIRDYFLSLDSAIDPPEVPTIGQLITAGNQKTYLRWKQNDPIDSRIKRVKIFYSSADFPVVNSNGEASGKLVFTGLSMDSQFIHRGIPNNQNAFYTIVNIDKYKRSSNYNSSGTQVEDFLHATVIPTADSNENTFPLVEVNNINYDLIDENTITIGWDQPQKSIENISAFFDQTVYIYGVISDEFGDSVSEDTTIRMSLTSVIDRESQADNVFGTTGEITFSDIDAYDFFVTRTNDGFFKGILRMTSNKNIMSQIKSARFHVQLKAILPKSGGYVPPNDATESGDPVSEYASLVEQLVDEETTGSSGENFYEYKSKTIRIDFTNPWEVELFSRDNQEVRERCYCIKRNQTTQLLQLSVEYERFKGIYIRATNPFVARAVVRYKGLPVESGNVEISIWDADSSNLCGNACSSSNESFEGGKLQPSTVVSPPDTFLPIIQGQGETYSGSGEFEDISFVDIPIYAPDLPQAIRLFVKGEKAGYSSVKDIYILFKSILQIDLDTSNEKLVVDGKDIAEFRVNAFIINPDYPNYNIQDSIDQSLVTYPEDLTVVEWSSHFVQTINDAERSSLGSVYSTDSVPLTNGVYSYTRSGVARNIFLGPVPKGNHKIEEQHEIVSSIVYQGLSSFAKIFFTVGPYSPELFDSLSARFLMEIDGGWRGDLPNQTFGGGGWIPAASNPLWADGINYKKVKISRNPRTSVQGFDTDEFAYADCFRSCASDDDNELLELDSGQIVEINMGSDAIEILHGDITEVEDPYTGLHYLDIGEEGFIDNGTAFIELNDEDVSDVTYFYIRTNQFIPQSGSREFGCGPDVVNDCTCLKFGQVLTNCDEPKWSPFKYISGSTTVFVNNNPLVLGGGGGLTGIPPCPICFNEPLSMTTVWKKVTDYFFSEEFGDPSNDFLFPVETLTDKNNFLDKDGNTIVQHTSDVDIRVKVLWRGQNIPDDTPIFVSVGDNTASSLFVSRQNIYYTTTLGESYSYVDVKFNARRYIGETTREEIEIFSIYDENNQTDRHIGQEYSITLDKKDDDEIIDEPPDLPTDPSLGVIVETPIVTPYSPTLDRYNILTDTWDQVANMGLARGNGFSGTVGNYIYYMGGLLGNDLNVSDRNEQYDILNDEWSDVTAMPVARFGGMSITIGDDIYVIGGIFPDASRGNDLFVSTLVEVYRADVDLWEELENLPIINEGSAIEEEIGVAFGTASHVFMNNRNYIYIMGGVKSIIAKTSTRGSSFAIEEYNQRILRYCVEDDVWEYSEVLRSNELNTYERISPLSIIFDNKMVVFNGAILSGEEFIYPSEDFYIDIEETFTVPSSGQWLNFGSGFMGDFPEVKFQSAMVEYNLNPSADHADYYIFGGFNDNSSSLDIVERITAQDRGFKYMSSYIVTNPSLDLTKMITGKHGINAELSNALGSPYVYIMGGYTNNRDSNYIDISFDI